MTQITSLSAALLMAGFVFVAPLPARADDTIEFARQHMRCDAWLEIHKAAGKDGKTMDDWAVSYLKRVARDFAVDMARKSGSRSQNDDGAEFTDDRVLTWLFLHCREHPADSLTASAMNWAMALSLVAGPRPLPAY